MDIKTVKDLYEFLRALVTQSHGDATVMFDTDARKFDYHMAQIGSAYFESECDPTQPYVSLHERRD